ncbi:MAG TPA: carbon-nitrogen hydrolase family protein [Alphaproteobacteria bacterium]|nr:carbon-nitrogen hydrolase family protein [Alphaproteobacteria bacterium]
MAKLKLACLQINSGPEIAPNLKIIGDLTRRAVDGGAEFVAMPENCAMLEPRKAKLLEKVEPQESHSALAGLRALAAETGVTLLVGSLAVKLSADKVANRSFLLDPTGGIVASYDKLHMFDVDLPSGESYRESSTFRPGDRAVVAPTPWGKLGMTVCYDLRFSALYRALAEAGATMLSVPSAFTRPTGQAHWHVLLRARAIETGSFVIAPAQTGEHAEGRKTYGHSLIVDPWGVVLADGGEDVGIVAAELDLDRVAEVRAMVPSLKHGRPIPKPETP